MITTLNYNFEQIQQVIINLVTSKDCNIIDILFFQIVKKKCNLISNQK